MDEGGISSIVRRAIFSPSSKASAEVIAGLAVATAGYSSDAGTRAPIEAVSPGRTDVLVRSEDGERVLSI